MAKAQVEFDLGCEDIIARNATACNSPLFCLGERGYGIIVIPPLTENLNTPTVDALDGFIAGEGSVLCCGDPPTLVDGKPSDRLRKLARAASWRRIEPAALPQTLLEAIPFRFAIRPDPDSTGILFHHRRRLNDGKILFLTNTSIDAPVSGHIESNTKGIEEWNLETGKISRYAFEKNDTGVKANFNLPPCGSLLLFLSNKRGKPAPKETPKATLIQELAKPTIKRIAPNVLTLDYVDITAGDETKQNTYFYQANRLAFQKNGMDRNPWDSAVQLHDRLITKKFPPESGFEATYKFKVEGNVPDPLHIVIERTDLYEITCNGNKVSAKKGQWWLDKAFGKIDITSAAKTGDNEVTIKASPMTIYHELEPAYLLGDFTLKPTDSGFTITPAQPLHLGPWNKQGCQFYAEGVSYTQQFKVNKRAGKYSVKLPEWYGSVARVTVNGKPAARIYRQPWQCDVTESIRKGKNTIEVTVVGTLKNTLGPHHNNPPLGSAWPAMFRKGPEKGPPPAEKYQNIPYGLSKPFQLINTN